MALKIDLGCGTNKRPGFVGVDLHAPNKPDIVADLMQPPIPGLEDGCAEYVLCSHTLEHLPLQGWSVVLDEIARLLKPGGVFELRIPHPSDENACIHGHEYVLTPLFWHHCRDHNWMRGKLVIDRIDEIPNRDYIDLCRQENIDHTKWAKHHRNTFTETVVMGRRQ